VKALTMCWTPTGVSLALHPSLVSTTFGGANDSKVSSENILALKKSTTT